MSVMPATASSELPGWQDIVVMLESRDEGDDGTGRMPRTSDQTEAIPLKKELEIEGARVARWEECRMKVADGGDVRRYEWSHDILGEGIHGGKEEGGRG